MRPLARQVTQVPCEIADIGIEYSWGKSKCHFRNINYCDQTSESATHRLRTLISDSLSPTVFTVDRVQKFAPKVRSYESAYRRIGDGADTAELLEIERLMKLCKSHRCTQMQDSSFIQAV